MKNIQAFTLIELLVVVLIIGILAAVALPQYQKTVHKARFTQGITALKSLVDAEQVYFLANGEYTQDLSLLDLDFPNNQIPYFTNLSVHNPGSSITPHIQILYYQRIDGTQVWLAAYLEDQDRPDIVCGVPSSTAANSEARKLCQTTMGTSTSYHGEPGWDDYPLSL